MFARNGLLEPLVAFFQGAIPPLVRSLPTDAVPDAELVMLNRLGQKGSEHHPINNDKDCHRNRRHGTNLTRRRLNSWEVGAHAFVASTPPNMPMQRATRLRSGRRRWSARSTPV